MQNQTGLRSLQLIALALLSPMVFIACGDPSAPATKTSIAASSITPTATPIVLPTATPSATPAPTATPAASNHSIIGTWANCSTGQGNFTNQDLFFSTVASQQTSYTFSGSSVTMTVSSYTASDCTGPSLVDYTRSGTFSVGSQTATVASPSTITASFQGAAQITAHDSTLVMIWGITKECGIQTWTADVANASNATCNAKFLNPIVSANMYGTDQYSLYLGTSASGLNMNASYTVQ